MKSLAVFSYEITTDPHFFDFGIGQTILNNMAAQNLNMAHIKMDAHERQAAYFSVCLMKEDIMNHVVSSRLYALNVNEEPHAGLNYFSDNYEPISLHLGNLTTIEKFYQLDQVIVLENPSVFQIVNEFFKNEKLEKVGLVCSSGQINLATYLLLDKLVASKVKLYYAGDFDAEGLLIAQRIKLKYKASVDLLLYQKEHYLKARSKKNMSDVRKASLVNCKIPELKEVAQLIEVHGQWGYQEALIEDYCMAIKQMTSYK